jgi:hypothetical protein
MTSRPANVSLAGQQCDGWASAALAQKLVDPKLRFIQFEVLHAKLLHYGG